MNVLKRMLMAAVTLILIFTLISACSNINTKTDTATAKAAETTSSTTKKPSGKILIAYFSRSGNTLEVAKQIQEKTGGDLFEIKTVEAYPKEYKATTEQAKRELDSGFRPALTHKVSNIDSYDIIFLGYPIWWGSMPMGVFTFLESHNLSNKIIIPFATHEGSQMGRSVADLTNVYPEATILEALPIRGSIAKESQNTIFLWLRRIKVIK